jgi:EamA domain-containing membrane protein RarD
MAAVPHDARAARGYAMVAAAAALFGINGAVSKVALSSGLSSQRLTEVRSAGAFVGLAAIVLLTALASPRTSRLAVGIALLIQYFAPLLIALWAFTVGGEHVRRRIWAARALALIVQVWHGIRSRGSGSRPRSPRRSSTPSTSSAPSKR